MRLCRIRVSGIVGGDRQDKCVRLMIRRLCEKRKHGFMKYHVTSGNFFVCGEVINTITFLA